MKENGKLPPVQQNILDALSDGVPHTATELVNHLYDSEMGSVSTVQVYIHHLRKYLRPKGQDIALLRINGVTMYQHVRLVAGGRE